MIVRMGLRMARTTHPEYRWRQIAVPVSVGLFLLTLFVSASVLSMTERELSRDENVHALATNEASPSDMFVVLRDDSWQGEQYPVIWIQPASKADPVIPVGMAALPAPGQAALSPALHEITLDNPDLAARYPDHLVLSEEAVATGGTLLAYVRVPEGRDLTTSASAIRVSEFGSAAPEEARLRLSFSRPVNPVAVSQGLIVFLILPGSILLTLGLLSASNVRDHRLAVLTWLGMSRRQRRALMMTETFALALPALVITPVAWALISPELTSVPCVGHTTFHGDLVVPVRGYALVVIVAALVIAGITLFLEGFEQRRKTTGPRPTALVRVALSPIRFAPLGFAIGAFIAWLWIGGSFGATLFYVGVILALGSIPLLLPSALRPIGDLLGRMNSVALLIAGRGLSWDPARRARPFAGVATIVALALATSGYFSFLWNAQNQRVPTPISEASAVSVSWLDPQRGDIDRIARTLKANLVLPATSDGSGISIGATCVELETVGVSASCNPNDPYTLSGGAKEDIAIMIGQPGSEVGLTPAGDILLPSRAVVFGRQDPHELELQVRTATISQLPGPYISSADQLGIRPSPLVAWLEAGLMLALGVLAIACVLALVDRLLATRHDRRHLLRIGMPPRTLATVEAMQFGVPYIVVSLIGAGVGLAICLQIVAVAGAEAPVRQVLITLIFAAVAGIVGTAGVAMFGYRSRRNDDRSG